MGQLTGIEYEKDASGRTRYIRVDIDKYGENESLQDFLDGIEALSRKGEPTIPFADFVKEENLRRGIENA
ncbi:hypothetical protein EZS27_015394 [termite gut metagenome]|uniref:Uncharacterized protein n=1 Tax=termite gut metagenome TaxID=433724 RepID=A0A5J4RR55_9ZZZZ